MGYIKNNKNNISRFGDKAARIFAGTIWGMAFILPIIMALPIIIIAAINEQEDDINFR